jgi:hypothetical protein
VEVEAMKSSSTKKKDRFAERRANVIVAGSSDVVLVRGCVKHRPTLFTGQSERVT